MEFKITTLLQRLRQKRREKQAGTKKRVPPGPDLVKPGAEPASSPALPSEADSWQVLATHLIPSAVGNERLAMSYVAKTVNEFHLPERRREQLGTAVAEATMNAMEHGNHYNPEIPVTLQILSSDRAIAVRISDQGGDSKQPALEEYEAPDIEAKLAELQTPRGWGLFLIQNMVDEMHVLSDEETHTIELILYQERDN